MAATSPQQESQAIPSRITGRSVLFGTLTAIALNVYTDHAGLVMGSSSLVKSQYPMAMLLPFVLWLFANIGLKIFWPKAALSGTELLVIYSMSWIAGVIPLEGWAAYWTSTMAVPTYYASPENRWTEIIFDILPWWTLPDVSPAVIRPFYDGLPPYSSIPWAGWLQPLFWWTAISLAVFAAGLCLCILFQRQWEDHERLAFPLAQFAVELTSGFDQPGRIPDIFRNKIFWAGFFTVFGVFAWNILGYFATGLPRITIYAGYLSKQIDLARDFPPIYLRILPPVVGLTYFCNLDILFSFWVLRLIAIVKLGIMDRTGFTLGLANQQAKSSEIINLESHGALVLLALWSIWAARGHLSRVWQAVVEGRQSVHNDSIISYRMAFIGFILTTAFIIGWMSAMGMSIPIALLQTALLYTAYFTVAKFTAASGFPHLLPIYGKGGGMVYTFTGTANLTPSDFVGTEFVNSSAFFGNTRIPAWPALPHHLKLHGATPNARIARIAALAFTAGLLASFIFIIYLAYAHGGQNLHTAPFSGRSNSASVRLYSNMTNHILNEQKTVFDPYKMAVWFIGIFEALVLIGLRSRLSWWPLHPIGLAFQNTSGPRIYSFSIFLTWAAKSLFLRIGGIALYRRAAPYFIGLPVGYVTGVIVSSIVDLIWFPTGGHWTHGW
ncbi:MAG: hypothetical protein F4W91_21535 [Gemmatimonadetes bacterium]|nr:hypothetical protein [Gemmatimonadota bacterium]